MGNQCCTGNIDGQLDNGEQQGEPIQMLKLGKDTDGEKLAQVDTHLNPSDTDQIVENNLQSQKNDTETQRVSQVHFEEGKTVKAETNTEKETATQKNQANSQ